MGTATSSFDYFDSGGHLVLGENPGDITRVEKMLAGLWVGAKARDPDCHSVYRLSLANLVLIGGNDDQQQLGEFASTFAMFHPSRILQLCVDPEAAELTASLSASCRKNLSGQGVICWERIMLTSPPRYDRRLASAARSLLVGRIATIVVLTLPGNTCYDLAGTAIEWADLLVTDSQGFAMVPRLLYWDCNGHRRARTVWLERQWEDLLPARHRIAAAYDDSLFRKTLAEVRGIECFGPTPLIRQLIAGWMVSRLGWTLLGADSKTQLVLRDNQTGQKKALTFKERSEVGVALDGNHRPLVRIETPLGDTTSDGDTGWGNPHWAKRVLVALHQDHSDPVFLTAVDAASRMDRMMDGRLHPPRVSILPDAARLGAHTANRFAELASEAVAQKGYFRVALAGGNTPKTMYKNLAGDGLRDRIPWDRIDWFWGDERWVPHKHPDSNYRMARLALFNHVPAASQRIYPVPTDLPTPAEAAETYEATIRDVWELAGTATPAFDLIILGLGTDGHTASLFPGIGLDPTDHRLVWGGEVLSLDTWRISLTPRTINAARHVIFMVSGPAKAGIVAATLYPAWENRHPAARVELQDGAIEWCLDREAASGIDPADFNS